MHLPCGGGIRWAVQALRGARALLLPRAREVHGLHAETPCGDVGLHHRAHAPRRAVRRRQRHGRLDRSRVHAHVRLPSVVGELQGGKPHVFLRHEEHLRLRVAHARRRALLLWEEARLHARAGAPYRARPSRGGVPRPRCLPARAERADHPLGYRLDAWCRSRHQPLGSGGCRAARRARRGFVHHPRHRYRHALGHRDAHRSRRP